MAVISSYHGNAKDFPSRVHVSMEERSVYRLLTQRQLYPRAFGHGTTHPNLLQHLGKRSELNLDGELGCLFSLAWSPDGNLLASTSGKPY